MPSASIPAALAVAGAASGVVGAGVSAIGSMQQGQAAAASQRYNAQVAAQNAQIAQQNATQAVQAGEVQASQSEAKTRAAYGAIKTAEAASGVDVNSGSALDVQASEAEIGQQDAINIRANAAKEAYGYQTQGIGFQNQETLDKSSAANDVTAGYMGGATSLLSGAGNAAMTYANFLNKNGFNPSAGA